MRLFPASSLSVQLSVLKNCKSSSCKHPVTPCGSFTAGTARTAIHGLGMPKRTSCALPRRSLYARMLTTARFPLCAPDSCTDTEGRWKYRRGKMQTKKHQINVKSPLGEIWTWRASCEEMISSIHNKQANRHHSYRIMSTNCSPS